MDLDLLKHVVGELSDLLPGAIVERVYEGEDRAVYLSLRRQRRYLMLLISPDRSMPRVHLVSSRPASAGKMSAFTQYLKSRVSGSRIDRISVPREDRMVEVLFSGMDADYRLIFELFGHQANMLLLDSSSKILSVYYPSGISVGSKRIFMPGFIYTPPEERPGASLPHSRKDTVEIDRQAHPFLPGRGSDTPANLCAELYYKRLLSEKAFSSMKTRLTAHVRTLISRTERKIEAISSDLAKSQRAEEYRRTGDMLLSHIKDVAPGADTFEFIDEDGRNVRAALDPHLSAAANAEMYFKRYKKAKAGREIIISRLEAARREEAGLRSLLGEIEQAADAAELERIASSPALADVHKRSRQGRGATEKTDTLPNIKKITFRGWEMLVGRSAAGNDYLSTKLARPHDVWLHAEGMPGSHVLIRNSSRGDIPEEIILKAASVAAFYSKGRGAKKVPVTYTKAVNVKKPKGARPGSVTISERKTIMVQPEISADMMFLDK